MRRLHLVLFILVLLVAALAGQAVKIALRKLAAQAIGQAIGTRAEVTHVQVDWFASEVKIHGVRVLAPHGFKHETLAFLPALSFRYDPENLKAGKLVLEELKLILERIVVETNPKNRVNLLEIGAVRERFNMGMSKLSVKSDSKGRIQIKKAELKLGKGMAIDYSLGHPVERDFPLLTRPVILTELENPSELTLYIVLAALIKAGLKVINPDPRRLPNGLLMQGEALVQEVETIFGVSEEKLKELIRN